MINSSIIQFLKHYYKIEQILKIVIKIIIIILKKQYIKLYKYLQKDVIKWMLDINNLEHSLYKMRKILNKYN